MIFNTLHRPCHYICPLSLNKLLNDIFQGFFAVTPLSGSSSSISTIFNFSSVFSNIKRVFTRFQTHLQVFERICNFSSPDFTVPKITPDSQNFNEGYLRIFRDGGRVREKCTFSLFALNLCSFNCFNTSSRFAKCSSSSFPVMIMPSRMQLVPSTVPLLEFDPSTSAKSQALM